MIHYLDENCNMLSKEKLPSNKTVGGGGTVKWLKTQLMYFFLLYFDLNEKKKYVFMLSN